MIIVKYNKYIYINKKLVKSYAQKMVEFRKRINEKQFSAHDEIKITYKHIFSQ